MDGCGIVVWFCYMQQTKLKCGGKFPRPWNVRAVGSSSRMHPFSGEALEREVTKSIYSGRVESIAVLAGRADVSCVCEGVACCVLFDFLKLFDVLWCWSSLTFGYIRGVFLVA